MSAHIRFANTVNVTLHIFAIIEDIIRYYCIPSLTLHTLGYTEDVPH